MTRQLNDGRLVDSLGSARRDAAHISTLTISYPSLSLFLGGEAITQTKTASHCRKFTLSDLSRRSTDRISGIVASIDYSTSTAVSHGPRVCLSLSSEAQKIEKEKTTTRRLGQKAFVLWNLSGCHWDGRRVVPPYCNKGTGGTHTERRKPLTRQRRPHLSNKQNGTLPVAGRGVWLQVEIVENVFNFFDDVVVVVFVLTAAQFERWMGRFGSERRNWRGRRSCRLLSRLGRRGMADSAGAAPIPLDRPRSGHLLFYLVISIL